MNGILNKVHQLKAFRALDDQEFSWVLYDVGNSAYTMLACSLIPIWFKKLAIGTNPGQVTSDQATAYYSIAVSIVTIIVALLGPVIGALADRKDRRSLYFNTTVAAGVICCVLNGAINSWLIFLCLYVLTKIFYSSSLTIYDSMLNDVTEDERMDEVSSYGYAWGYIGSCIPFLVALIAYVLGPDMLGKISDELSKIIGFTVTAVWWLLVSLPLIKGYQQKNCVDDSDASPKKILAQLVTTAKHIFKENKKVLLYLIAYFFYIDGVGTIIDNCINIGTDLGLPTVGQVVFLLLAQVVAWIGSLVFASLSKKYDTSKLILVCIAGYTCVCLYALRLKTLFHFGVLAFGVTCFQGAIQSLSRSYYAKIIPEKNSGEYFGIFDIFCKGASFLGSAVIAFVKLQGQTINVAVASLGGFFVVGFIFLMLADKQPTVDR